VSPSAPPPGYGPPPAGFTPAPMAAVDPSVDYKERLRLEMQRYERELIVNALAAAAGNVTAAAQALKIPVRTLTHKMQALGIKKRFESE
ncbi:MAG TPA: helix-turn-helix domain-containing protein, partial [Labilithrix sp.]|nr:helix-turn-helix domain-containing protein [Labilithrix sp.]